MYINSLVSSTVHTGHSTVTFDRFCSVINEATSFLRALMCGKNCIIYAVFTHKNPLHVLLIT